MNLWIDNVLPKIYFMKEVNSNFNFRGALNAEHYQVHSDLLDAIPTEVASGLGLIGLRN